MSVLDPMVTDATVSSSTDVGATLAWYRHGVGDPTTWIDRIGRGLDASGRFVRSTWTPDGPGTLQIRWRPQCALEADAWGPGAEWLLARVPHLVGDADPGIADLDVDAHPVVARCVYEDRHRRFGASSTLYHELLPTIIEQRITSGEAVGQWRRLCHALSEPAPGPFARLLLPPAPRVLRQQPSWWFHPLGIERKRAQPLIEVARHADKMFAWSERPPSEVSRLLRLIRGVGVWTVGSVLGPAMGDQDAVAVGDYHIKNIVAWNLAGEPRASDERMLELLEPYVGRRGRVVAAILRHGDGAPKFGPKQRILPMREW